MEPVDERAVADLVDQYLAEPDGEDGISLPPAVPLHRSARQALERFSLELTQREVEPPAAELSLQATWARIRARQVPSPRVKTHRAPWQSWRVGLAAMVVVMLVGGTGWALWQRTPSMLNVPRNAGHAQRYVTTNAQRATIQLSDGSSVELGSASELTVLPSFNQNNRTVLVRGAAYFQVADRSTLPFVVRSDNAVARVLGTEFAVRKYPEDTSVTIVVASGKVSVGTAGPQTPSNATTSVVLTKGDNAAVDAQGTVQISHTTNIARALAWTHGMLVFENTPFRTVIPEVERLYDLKIQVTDSSILDRHVTTQLTSESASEAVHLLASIMNVSVTQHGQQVKFFEILSGR